VSKLSVVIPLYNEEANLALYPGELFPAIDALGLPWELVLVDDGSSDGTLAAARALAAARPGSVVVVHGKNRGLGAAVRTGFAAATGDRIVTLDADLTFDPCHVRRLVERFDRGDADLVIGSPALAGYHGVPWHRVALSNAANFLYQVVLGRRITAVTPIFRLYRAEALKGIELESEGFAINAEILAKLLLRSARVVEVPAPLGTRRHGVSKLDTRAEIGNHLRLLARILGWRWRRVRG
jgi:dolichol-phosphate mannosyltransferase